MSAGFVDCGDSFSVQLAGLPEEARRRIVDYLDRQVELGLLVPVAVPESNPGVDR